MKRNETQLWWSDEQADHIRDRPGRYLHATRVEPRWAIEAAEDPWRIERNPDPKSHIGAIRIIGFSLAAGFVITVIALPDSWEGVTAWKTSGADLREYMDGSRE